APTIILPARGGRTPEEPSSTARPFLALGGAGSRRILSAMLQVIENTLHLGMPLDAAVAAPRIHALASRKGWVERPAASQPLLAPLAYRFRAVRLRAPLSYSMGCVQAIRRDEDGHLLGASDPRREGTASSCIVPKRGA